MPIKNETAVVPSHLSRENLFTKTNIKTKRPHLYQFHFIMQQFCDVEQYFWRERKNANTELNEASRSGSSCEEFDTFIEWF